jgi:hypothetical protein
MLCRFTALAPRFRGVERKNVIRGKVEIASVVKAYYQHRSENDLRLFFPFAGGYVIMEFGSYLNYRGVPVEGLANEAAGPISVVLAEASSTRARLVGKAEDGPCVWWTSIWCEVVSGPAPGDLVIVLPDDEGSLAEASAHRARGELLFSYEPHPSIPHWLFWLFDSLPIGAETRYRYDKLPDRWMDGSVTIWK